MKKRQLAALGGTLLAIVASTVVLAQPAHAATGLRVSGQNIVEANGQTFVMRGVNHHHVWSPTQTASFANIKALGANTIRVVLGSGQRWGPSNDVRNVIDLCKRNRLICVLEVHDTTGYGEQAGAASLDQAVNYWIGQKNNLVGQENHVMINIGNEPIGNNNASQWTNATANAVRRMRANGFEHLLMVDAPNWGQDWQNVMRDNAQTVWNADTMRNTVFSVHMYSVYNSASSISAYFDAFRSKGLPLVVGEFGWRFANGEVDDQAIMAQAVSRGIGYLGWSWAGNSDPILDMTNNFNPTQLTTWGQRIFNDPNGIKATAREASIYGGGTPTAGPVRAVAANKCLDVPNVSQTNGTQVAIWDCNGGTNQRWTHTSGRQLMVYGSKCLDASGHGTSGGTPVVIWDCTGGTNQQWAVNPNGTITGVHSGLCLNVANVSTANGALVQLQPCTSGTNQQWSLG
jgi:mannan endo-1,4-beta-mannosidase